MSLRTKGQRPPTDDLDDESEEPEVEFLTFRIAGEAYGVAIDRVQEIRSWEAPTRVPNAPNYVAGLINLRGLIVPVIDLRLRFGLKPLPYTDTTVVIVVKTQSLGRSRMVSLAVDAVSDVCRFPESLLRRSAHMGDHGDAEFIQALISSVEQALLVLDVDGLMGSGELAPEPGPS